MVAADRRARTRPRRITRLDAQLYYTLPEFGIRMPFKPTDFTQVNHQINRVLVHKALGLLDVQPDERVADLFCGLGNFTLPLATQAREVVGIEGSTALTTRALENARANGLAAKTTFYTRNLFEVTKDDLVALGKFDRMLIDPPRDGAVALARGAGRTAPDAPGAAAAAHRVRVVQPVDAGARRRHPDARAPATC